MRLEPVTAAFLFLLLGLHAVASPVPQDSPALDPATRERVGQLKRAVVQAADTRALERSMKEALEIYEKASSTPSGQAWVKGEIVPALKVVRDRELKVAREKAPAFEKRSLPLFRLKEELNRRRAEALKLVHDESVYVREDHPDWPKGDRANGQEKVDRLVLKRTKGSVEELWQAGGGVVLPVDGGLLRALEILRALGASYLPGITAREEAPDLSPFAALLRNLHPQLTILNFSLSDAEAEDYAWNRRVELYNSSLVHLDVGKDEKAHARIVNDYREMMGRRRLFLDPRLSRAARKHSGVQNAAQKLWHVGSDGSPQDRAAKEGFPGGAGENVALGHASPSEIWWRGWYKASDHHRNALTEAYTCLGYGYQGNVGTQMFGAIDAPEEIKKLAPR